MNFDPWLPTHLYGQVFFILKLLVAEKLFLIQLDGTLFLTTSDNEWVVGYVEILILLLTCLNPLLDLHTLYTSLIIPVNQYWVRVDRVSELYIFLQAVMVVCRVIAAAMCARKLDIRLPEVGSQCLGHPAKDHITVINIVKLCPGYQNA